MKYICTSCNYIFDESQDLIENTNLINKIENYERCPVCDEYDTFIWIKEEVNYLDDNSFWFLEFDHLPIVELIDEEKQIIKVTAWKWPHSMTKDHKIISISLYDEYWDLVIEEFLYEDAQPETEFDIYDFDEYEIRIKCINHWVWGKKFVK